LQTFISLTNGCIQ